MDNALDALMGLRAPEMVYRPRNYWGWLEHITPEEVAWQVDRMADAGLGGYVMHARGGLTIPYAGPQWMDSVRAMIAAGRRRGMTTIVDDEHGWPSGFGAGQVNGLGEAYQLKYLLCEEIPASRADLHDSATLGLWLRNGFAPVADPARLPPDTPLVRVYKKTDPYYVDNMDPMVVRAFIEASYEDYNRAVGSGFGQGIYGVFSDEPQLARYATPWSDTLPALFEARYGYALRERLAEVFYEHGECRALRYDLFRLMQDCFADSYARQIYDWCSRHRLALMGHICLEEHLYGQIRCAAGAMPFYAYMHVPGIDWLCRVPVSNLCVLQMTSAAAQLGRRALSEMFGCAGWGITFEEMKWIAQWQAALGVDDQLQHLGLYSLRGSRKREYPASLFYQQPWFDSFRPYNDYFARVGKLVARSVPEVDVLVLHPMATAWIAYNGQDAQAVDAVQSTLDRVTDDLLALGVMPHYGDETLMASHGRVAGGKLWIGRMGYQAVLLPDIRTMDRSTLGLLTALLDADGRVVIGGGAPTLLEGRPDAVLTPFVARCQRVALDRVALAAAFPPRLRVRPVDGDNDLVYIPRRMYEGRRFYYIVNNDLHRARDFALEGQLPDRLVPFDPMTGRLADATVDPARLHLEGAEALILFEADGSVPIRTAPRPLPHALTLAGDFRLTAVTPNALILDHFELSLDGQAFAPDAYFLDVQQQLMRQGRDCDVWMRFHFVVEEMPAGGVCLLLENPELHQLWLNGQRIANAPVGWAVDKCLEKLPLPVRVGDNQLVLRRRFENPADVYRIRNDSTIHEAEANRVTVKTELESVFLWGAFGVRSTQAFVSGTRRTVHTAGDFRLTRLPDTVDVAALVEGGFPFFAGTLTLEKAFALDRTPARARLTFARPDANLTNISINSAPATTFLWAPYEMDATPCLRAGDNTLTLQLTNSCRNLFGPHYSPEGDSYAVGPHSYGKQTPHMNLRRFGIAGGVTIAYE